MNKIITKIISIVIVSCLFSAVIPLFSIDEIYAKSTTNDEYNAKELKDADLIKGKVSDIHIGTPYRVREVLRDFEQLCYADQDDYFEMFEDGTFTFLHDDKYSGTYYFTTGTYSIEDEKYELEIDPIGYSMLHSGRGLTEYDRNDQFDWNKITKSSSNYVKLSIKNSEYGFSKETTEALPKNVEEFKERYNYQEPIKKEVYRIDNINMNTSYRLFIVRNCGMAENYEDGEEKIGYDYYSEDDIELFDNGTFSYISMSEDGKKSLYLGEYSEKDGKYILEIDKCYSGFDGKYKEIEHNNVVRAEIFPYYNNHLYCRFYMQGDYGLYTDSYMLVNGRETQLPKNTRELNDYSREQEDYIVFNNCNVNEEEFNMFKKLSIEDNESYYENNEIDYEVTADEEKYMKICDLLLVIGPIIIVGAIIIIIALIIRRKK